MMKNIQYIQYIHPLRIFVKSKQPTWKPLTKTNFKEELLILITHPQSRNARSLGDTTET